MTQVEAHRHLFIDDYEIDSMSGLSRSLLGATLYEGNPVIHNDYPTFRVDMMPYGGVKDSGFGREGLRWSIVDMTEERLLALWPR